MKSQTFETSCSEWHKSSKCSLSACACVCLSACPPLCHCVEWMQYIRTRPGGGEKLMSESLCDTSQLYRPRTRPLQSRGFSRQSSLSVTAADHEW